MPTFHWPRLSAERARPLLLALMRVVALAMLLFLPVALLAGWFDKLTLTGTTAPPASKPAKLAPGTLEMAVRYVKALPPRTDGVALAAEATHEGHWRFVSRKGETFTAGTPDEMKRAIPVLHPEAKADTALSLHLTVETVFRTRAALKALPPAADLNVVVGDESYRLLRRGDSTGERYFAEVRSNLVIEMGDRRLFDEAIWQLSRPLNGANVRVLALTPDGASTLSASPRIDRATRRALVDVIDPASLAPAMASVRGQTLVITGRIERDVLYVKPASGPERSLLTKDLFRAADQADVNLIVLQASPTPRQPGGRNWLWQSVEVQGLDEALQRARLADFMNALGAQHRRLAVVALPVGSRTVLDVTAADDVPGALPAGPVSGLFSGIVYEITGKVVATSARAHLRSAARQHELDQRIIAGIPSELQTAYLVLLVLSLLGVPVSRAWWHRIWPPEAASEYAGRTGYWAACSVRFLAFLLMFLPLTAVVAVAYNLGSQVRDLAMVPVRGWRWLVRRTAGRKSTLARETGGAATGARPPATPNNSGRAWPVLDGPGTGRRYTSR